MSGGGIAFYGKAQDQEQLLALHFVLIGFGALKPGARVPDPGSNEAIVMAYAHMLRVENLDEGICGEHRYSFVAPLPTANRWVYLSAIPEAPHEVPAQLVLEFVDTNRAVELRRKDRGDRAARAATAGDRW